MLDVDRLALLVREDEVDFRMRAGSCIDLAGTPLQHILLRLRIAELGRFTFRGRTERGTKGSDECEQGGEQPVHVFAPFQGNETYSNVFQYSASRVTANLRAN